MSRFIRYSNSLTHSPAVYATAFNCLGATGLLTVSPHVKSVILGWSVPRWTQPAQISRGSIPTPQYISFSMPIVPPTRPILFYSPLAELFRRLYFFLSGLLFSDARYLLSGLYTNSRTESTFAVRLGHVQTFLSSLCSPTKSYGIPSYSYLYTNGVSLSPFHSFPSSAFTLHVPRSIYLSTYLYIHIYIYIHCRE